MENGGEALCGENFQICNYNQLIQADKNLCHTLLGFHAANVNVFFSNNVGKYKHVLKYAEASFKTVLRLPFLCTFLNKNKL